MDLINTLKQEDGLQKNLEEKVNNQLKSDTVSLLKKKMIMTNDLINQYKKSMEKCAELQDKLTAAVSEKQEFASKYSSTMEKVEKLKLKNLEQEKSIEKYKQSFTNQKIKIDENTQLINQLNFKITEIQEENQILKECKQFLESENKVPKKMVKERKSVKQVSQCRRTGIKNISVNTDPVSIVPHLKKIDQSTMTDVQKDPLECKKCVVKDNPSIEQILEIMTDTSWCNTPMPLLSPDSPLKTLSFSEKEPSKITTYDPHSMEADQNKHLTVPVVSKSTEFKNNSVDQVTELAKKVKKMKKILKGIKNENSKISCIKSCCSSKETEFIVQLPTKRQILDSNKSDLCKIIKVKRLNSKNKSIKKRKCLSNEWKVESIISKSSVKK